MANMLCRKITLRYFGATAYKVDPKLKLSPVFEGVNEDIRVWPDARGDHLVDGAIWWTT